MIKTLDNYCDESQIRFAESTRRTSFALTLGAREIRLLGRRDLPRIADMEPGDIRAARSLIRRGLLLRIVCRPPILSPAGKLVRKLLQISKHTLESA